MLLPELIFLSQMTKVNIIWGDGLVWNKQQTIT